MPKQKVRKSISKRFRITKTGKVLTRKPGKMHLLTKKSPRRKSDLRRSGAVADVNTKKIKRLLPYG